MGNGTRRVAITGAGMVTALGMGTALNWARLRAGECGIRSTVQLGDAVLSSLSSRVAAWVDDAAVEAFSSAAEGRGARGQPRYIQFALMAAHEAILEAGLSQDCLSSARTGVVVGVGMGPLDVVGEAYQQLHHGEGGSRRISPHTIPRILPGMGASHISLKYGIRGPIGCPSTACASGAQAIGDAFRLIRHAYADVVIAGGSEASVNALSMASFCQARALSTQFNGSPHESSRPFDRDRDGFVIGEGSGVIVLEVWAPPPFLVGHIARSALSTVAADGNLVGSSYSPSPV